MRSNLFRARIAANLSQDELAPRVGITQSTLDKIEKGKTRRVDSQVLIGLSEVLGVAPSTLLLDDGMPYEPPRDGSPPERSKYRRPRARGVTRSSAEMLAQCIAEVLRALETP